MTYRLADTAFTLDTVYDRTQKMLADYITDDTPSFSITVTGEDIDRERARMDGGFSDRYLETLAVYRKLCDRLLEKDVLLFHGSAVAVDGAVYLFAAKSGTGKSTHVRLWRERFGDRAVMVNDDKPLLGIRPEGVTVYGTPWDGKHRLSSNVALPLKALCLLERDGTNHIERVRPETALPALLQQAYRAESMERILPLVLRLAEAVPLYRLGCNMDPEAAEVAWMGMQ